MGIRMVRQPSQTPNVTNIDDIIPFRYAYGDQDGYVIGKGNEISHTIDGSTFRVNSGRVVLQGVETDIDANGVSFTIDNASETRYFVVYYEVNLATQSTAIKLSNYDTAGYPIIDLGDDLTANSSGITRMELYRFSATSGVISNVTKVAKAIEYSESLIKNEIDLFESRFKEDNPTKFGNYIVPKLIELFDGKTSVSSGITTIGIFKNIDINDDLIVEGEILYNTNVGITPISFNIKIGNFVDYSTSYVTFNNCSNIVNVGGTEYKLDLFIDNNRELRIGKLTNTAYITKIYKILK